MITKIIMLMEDNVKKNVAKENDYQPKYNVMMEISTILTHASKTALLLNVVTGLLKRAWRNVMMETSTMQMDA